MAVYQERASRLIRMTGVPGTNYRLFVGTVKWDEDALGEEHEAACVLIQKGSTRGWREASAAKEIMFRIPAHILRADVETVTAELAQLVRDNPPP